MSRCVTTHTFSLLLVMFGIKANSSEKEYFWKSIYLRFAGSLKPSSSICYVLFSSEEKYCGALLLFHKIPLVTSYTNPGYTVNFKFRVLSVFPLSSDDSTKFHIETPSLSIIWSKSKSSATGIYICFPWSFAVQFCGSFGVCCIHLIAFVDLVRDRKGQ